MDKTYYCHRSTGSLVWEYGKGTKYWSPYWALVMCDNGIVDYYAWLCKSYGVNLQKGSRAGAHISFIKGEKPPVEEIWGKEVNPIEFWHAHTVRMDNDCHIWVDVWSDQLIELRARLGLPPKVKMSYHLTIGRLS